MIGCSYYELYIQARNNLRLARLKNPAGVAVQVSEQSIVSALEDYGQGTRLQARDIINAPGACAIIILSYHWAWSHATCIWQVLCLALA